ncbi:hypothetical protein LIER_25096 [Lithospermum erythrorhizon]|uniref:Uncharacterized protein n=1 Tax=Lithospermum erythrorhizon TaxID=34254 RepID=A0AAV3R776_LITER
MTLLCLSLTFFCLYAFGFGFAAHYYLVLVLSDGFSTSFLEYTPSYPFYRAQRRTWIRLCRSLQGKSLRELTDMADEVLTHFANGQAFNFTFVLALRHAMECYFEKVGSVLQTVSEAAYKRDFLLHVLEEALYEVEIV